MFTFPIGFMLKKLASLVSWTLASLTYDSVYFTLPYASIVVTSFNTTGTKFYLLDISSYTIYQYSLSTAWDITTLSYDNVSFGDGGINYCFTCFSFSSSGNLIFIRDPVNDYLYQYPVRTAWDLSSVDIDSPSILWGTLPAASVFFNFSPDGTKLYSDDGTNLNQYNCIAPWTPNNSAIEATLTISVDDALQPYFSSDGTKLYIVNSSDTTNVYYSQYTLATAKLISTATLDGTYTTQIGTVNFNTTGTKVFGINVVGPNRYLKQYSVN